MSQTHIHLLITHLPIFGSILGGLVLAHGIGTKSIQTNIAAYYILILSSIGAGIAYLTGEGTEETVEKLPGVIESSIKQHEEIALYALIALIILGVTALIACILTYRKSNLASSFAFVVLLLSMISFGLVARTGYLGGQIRHTEISNAVSSNLEKDDD
ncbi:MAG: hypothetical protein CFE25_07155 [Chitinophagaceae bacterium BSSC1]|nr:MAG: hypothetical protein CFE25_07155 [Chitinophagaceae bacterium BSSC1]